MKLLIKKFVPKVIYKTVLTALSTLYRKKLLADSKFKASKMIFDRQNSQLKLEIGAGEKKGKNDWITLDLSAKCDLYWDLLLPLPFPKNSIDMIYSSHVLEHFTYEDLMRLLINCYGTLKVGGKFSVCVPDASIFINGYVNPKEFDSFKYCASDPGFNFNSEIDYINYTAYMGGHHRHMFDSKNLIAILQKVGFKNVNLRQFDPLIDKLERDYESIYAEAER